MEVIRLENMSHYREDMIMPGDIFLLQVGFHCVQIFYLNMVKVV